jgi:DNA-nicking Smr family endonuclease
LSNDDKDLFRQAVSGTKPIKSVERVAPAGKKPPPKARFSQADESAALAESLEAEIDDLEAGSGEALRYRRQSVGQRTMRKLARGKYAVQAELDLHGMTVEEARPRLADFIKYSADSGKTCVRVVHGKGLGSGERGPRLKPSVNRWLRKWDYVLAFVSTRQVDGGTGAVYVLLDKT